MPNIEMWGFGPFEGLTTNEAMKVRSKIFHIILDSPKKDDVVVTLVHSTSYDINACSTPYLRLIGTNEAELEVLARWLEPIGFDIEIFPPIKFIPKKK